MKYSSTEQSIGWLKARYAEGTLVIRPPYQRKPVWTAKQKCSLIESILLSYPVPEIYIHVETDPDGKEKYAIVDGQQRVRTVLQFVGSESDVDQLEYNKFVLDKIPASSVYYGRAFADLEEAQRRSFYEYVFAVRYLRVPAEDEVRDMFGRLNKFLTPLKPQELRNSMYTGPFAQLANDLADDDFWSEHRIIRLELAPFRGRLTAWDSSRALQRLRI